ncbi:MAG: hypothetical protein ACYC5N_07530 [Endomicrobiales bacterium]
MRKLMLVLLCLMTAAGYAYPAGTGYLRAGGGWGLLHTPGLDEETSSKPEVDVTRGGGTMSVQYLFGTVAGNERSRKLEGMRCLRCTEKKGWVALLYRRSGGA